MTHEQYVHRFKGTAISRAKHWMLQRNAAVALGNTGGPDILSRLEQALRRNPHPIVRGHVAWAVGEIGQRSDRQSAESILQSALIQERDSSVQEEIRLALADLE